MMPICARPGCGNQTKELRKKHCSRECAYAGRITSRCEQCGKPRKRGRRFCSRQCAIDAHGYSPPAPHTEALKMKLREMSADGATISEMAAKLRITRNAVVGLRRRMNLPKRPSPIGVARDPSLPKAPQQRTERVSTTQKRMETIAATAGHDAGNTLAPLASLRIPLEQRQFAALGRRPPLPAPTNVVQLRLPIARARACQYPLWGALHADDRPVFARMCDDPRPGLSPRFCGAPAAVGCSYCKRHVAITHRKSAEVAA